LAPAGFGNDAFRYELADTAPGDAKNAPQRFGVSLPGRKGLESGRDLWTSSLLRIGNSIFENGNIRNVQVAWAAPGARPSTSTFAQFWRPFEEGWSVTRRTVHLPPRRERKQDMDGLAS
jgi:hypothetical protein